MKLLLDTHIWAWYSEQDSKLSHAHQKRIAASEYGSIAVSAVSVWEIAMLAHYGRIILHQSPAAWVKNAATSMGIEIIPLTADIALESYNLPGEFHKDPADRMIVATARQNGLTLMTQDKAILAYAKKGHVKTTL